MIYYLVQAIDVIDYSKIEILKQCKTEDDAKKSLKQVALKLIKENGGARQVKIATDKMTDSLHNIKKGDLNTYPLGYYIQEKEYIMEDTKLSNTIVEIYEKYEISRYIYSSYKIHLVKVIVTVPITIDNNLELTCNVGSLYSSMHKPIVKKKVPSNTKAVMDELKEILEKRNVKKAKQKKKLEEQKKLEEEMQEILNGIIAKEKLKKSEETLESDQKEKMTDKEFNKKITVALKDCNEILENSNFNSKVTLEEISSLTCSSEETEYPIP